MPDGSIDCITSTNTLEHIPPADITAIYRELRRIIAPDGVISFQIDYQDHYSYFDPSIGVYHFLTYDEASWRRYNPSLHFQNRLRHHDHVALIESAGFEIVAAEVEGGSDDDLAALADLDLAPPYRDLDPGSLAIRTSRLTLRASR
ncbi:class I SAM-dependent methyltransferase [Aquihabitans daechungensis]|uniref:class I SAM-dependent methyltransferase n=1 Tax=Aquihabitans daechungensis TaxID=1052257 RepID=UPI003B9FDDC8